MPVEVVDVPVTVSVHLWFFFLEGEDGGSDPGVRRSRRGSEPVICDWGPSYSQIRVRRQCSGCRLTVHSTCELWVAESPISTGVEVLRWTD